jgi:hypothetical protein
LAARTGQLEATARAKLLIIFAGARRLLSS